LTEFSELFGKVAQAFLQQGLKGIGPQNPGQVVNKARSSAPGVAKVAPPPAAAPVQASPLAGAARRLSRV
jgi:hypothetical protein